MSYDVILSLDTGLAQRGANSGRQPLGGAAMTGRALIDCGTDPVGDLWAVALWSATAELHFCRHAPADEGAFDSAGRWRRKQVRHNLVGRPADQARAAAMARHFCALVRISARAWATGKSSHARRSFEIGCAKRLVTRLRAALALALAAGSEHAAEDAANLSALRAAGRMPPAAGDVEGISNWDRTAIRHGKAAADNISLVLRERAASAAAPKPSRTQLALPF